ncbi:N-acetylmuramoyl-L-alanine amidase [Paenibacillus chitinolyticus]
MSLKITEMLLTNDRARPGTKITPKGIVIHWTANERRGADAVANRNYFNNPTTEPSAHYIVDDKQIIRCLPENEMGYHVGAKVYKPDALARLSLYPNNCTIGIEMCVNADGDFKAMYQRTLELTVDILKRYGWGVDMLWRHFDITGKNCPAYFVSDDYARRFTGLTATQAWAKFKDDVHRLLTGYPQENESKREPVTVQITLAPKGFLIDGVSHLPVRAVAEAVGAEVEFDAATSQVKVNSKIVTATIEYGVSYTPARELAGILNLEVEWDGYTKTVKLKGRV